MTENRIFTLCRMIAWVVFLRMFWNFISSLPVKRRGSLSFLTIFTFAVPELMDLIWRKIGFFMLCRMITWVVFLRMFWNFISRLPVKRGGSLSFLVGTISNVLVMEIGWTDVGSGGYILVSCAHSNTSYLWFCLLMCLEYCFVKYAKQWDPKCNIDFNDFFLNLFKNQHWICVFFYERIICVTVKFKFCRKQKCKPFYHLFTDIIMEYHFFSTNTFGDK
jgi:hypothetical protein